MPRAKKFANTGSECVACGACVRVCPVQALSVPKGIRAKVDTNTCIGCGKCERACPAAVITMIANGEPTHA